MHHSFEYIQSGMHDQSNLQMLMGLDFTLNVTLNRISEYSFVFIH
jgi:hypothetical protein